MKTRYGIVGTGALGGYYGGLLAHAGHDVHFLVNSDFDHIKLHGLKVDSKFGDFQLPQVHAYLNPVDMPRCDVIVIALKSTQNHLLKSILPHLVTTDSIAVVLQNGLHVEADCIPYFEPNNILGGCCFLCSNKVGPGHIHHLDFGHIHLGQYFVSDRNTVAIDSYRLASLLSDFQKASIRIEYVESLLEARWKKLAWNIPFNGLSVILDASTDEIMRDPDSRALVLSLMQEIQLSAKACGISITDSHVVTMMEYTDSMVPYDSSMRLDYLHRRPIEVEMIFGNPLREATRNGFRPASIELIYQQLVFLDRRNRGI